MTKQQIRYDYAITSDHRREYVGLRYFAHSIHTNDVIQVVVSTGDSRRGKSNCIGVYVISRTSFFSNYFGPGYVIPCDKKTYLKAFDKITEIIRPS